MRRSVLCQPEEIQGPLDGVSSWHLLDIARSVGRVENLSGRSAELVATLLKRCLDLGRVFANTPQGRRWLERQSYKGLNGAFIYRLAIDEGELMEFCVSTIDAAYDDPKTRLCALMQMTPEFFESIRWLMMEWQEIREFELPKMIILLSEVIPSGHIRALH